MTYTKKVKNGRTYWYKNGVRVAAKDVPANQKSTRKSVSAKSKSVKRSSSRKSSKGKHLSGTTVTAVVHQLSRAELIHLMDKNPTYFDKHTLERLVISGADFGGTLSALEHAGYSVGNVNLK